MHCQPAQSPTGCKERCFIAAEANTASGLCSFIQTLSCIFKTEYMCVCILPPSLSSLQSWEERERETEEKQPQRERFPDPKRITQAREASWESSVHSAWALTTYPVLTMAVLKAGQPNPASSMTRQGWKEIFQDIERGRGLAVFPTRFQAQVRLARKSKTILHLPLLTSPHKTPHKHVRKRKSIMRAWPLQDGVL